MRDLHRIAARIFNTPVMVHPDKAGVIVNALSPFLFGDVKVQGADEMDCPDERRRRRTYEVTPEGIAIIEVHGTLVQRSGWLSAGSGLTSYRSIQEEVIDAMAADDVKGLLFDIDSPGGEVNGAFDLADTLAALRGEKPMYAVANDDAFSAAYLIASVADKLYVTQTGGVGSVGVIAIHMDQSEWDQKEGLKFSIFRAGKYKGEHGPHEPLSDHAVESLQGELDRLYEMFTGKVANLRGMAQDAVKNTEAGLYFGEDGISIGFADELGTLDTAREALIQEIQEPPMRGQPAAPSPFGQEVNAMPDEKKEQAGAAAPVAAEEKTPETSVLSLDEARKKATEEGQEMAGAYALEVTQLCSLAGHPEMIQGFLQDKTELQDVREALVAANAKQDEAAQIDTGVDPRAGMGVKPLNLSVNDVYARLAQGFNQKPARN